MLYRSEALSRRMDDDSLPEAMSRRESISGLICAVVALFGHCGNIFSLMLVAVGSGCDP